MKDASLRTGLANVQNMLTEFGKRAVVVGAALAAVGASIRGPLLAAANKFTNSGSEIAKLSRSTGMTAETLSELRYAADQSNISLEKAIELSKSGANDFAVLRNEARRLGVTMTSQDAVAADNLRRTLAGLHTVFDQMIVTVGSAVAPALQMAAQHLREWGANVGKFLSAHKEWFALLSKIGSALFVAGTATSALGAASLGLSHSLGAVSKVMSAIKGSLAVITATMATLSSPIALVTIAIGAGIAVFLRYTEAGQAVFGYLASGFKQLYAIVKEVFGGIRDALQAGEIQLAAQILWTGLKTVWQMGVNYLMDQWDTFRQYLIENYKPLVHGWITTVATIQKVWAEAVAGLINVWNEFRRVLDVGSRWSAKQIVKVMPEYWKADEQGKAQMMADIDKEFDARAGILDKNIKEALRDAERRKKAAQDQADLDHADIDAGGPKAKAARDAAARERERELNDLKRQLAALVDRAKKAREEIVMAAPPDIGQMNMVVSSMKSRGTFNPFALSGMGGGDPTKPLQKKVDKTNKLLERIDQNLQKNKPLAFVA